MENMICDRCKLNKPDNDFINNQNICFRCVYNLKTQKTTEKRTAEPMVCRVCNKEIVRKTNLKKRQRSVFCSDECAKQGQKELVRNHWTRKIRREDSWVGAGGIKWKLNRK